MNKIAADHLAREAVVYIRQSTPDLLRHNHESRRRQYGLADRVRGLGREESVIIDEDLGRSGGGSSRPGFERLPVAICEGRVGIVLSLEAARLARNGGDSHTLLEFPTPGLREICVSGLSRSALKASTSRTTSAEFLLSCESSVNTPADSQLDGLIQAHHWRVDSDRWAQVTLDLYKPLEPNVIMNASDQNPAGGGDPPCVDPPKAPSTLSRARLPEDRQQPGRARNEADRPGQEKLSLHGLGQRRQGRRHRLHPDRNRQAQRRRAAGLAQRHGGIPNRCHARTRCPGQRCHAGSQWGHTVH